LDFSSDTFQLALDAIDAASRFFQLVVVHPGRGAGQPLAGTVHDR
jgi:hypothetical protein